MGHRLPCAMLTADSRRLRLGTRLVGPGGLLRRQRDAAVRARLKADCLETSISERIQPPQRPNLGVQEPRVLRRLPVDEVQRVAAEERSASGAALDLEGVELLFDGR
jgi:hypothetical protein